MKGFKGDIDILTPIYSRKYISVYVCVCVCVLSSKYTYDDDVIARLSNISPNTDYFLSLYSLTVRDVQDIS